jgi:phosphoenolpyruvate phosphomutase
MLRSSITAMQKTAAEIYQSKSLKNIESQIVPVKEIFRLQNADELKQAEKKYLPQK